MPPSSAPQAQHFLHPSDGCCCETSVDQKCPSATAYDRWQTPRERPIRMSKASYLLSQASLASNLPRQTHEFSWFDGAPLRVGPGLDGCLSKQRGFLCRPESQRRLPAPAFAAWERTARRLPLLVRQGRHRRAIRALPPRTAEFAALSQRYLARASLVLSVLAHAYFFAPRDQDEEADASAGCLRLPDHVDEPWVRVCARLGRPFTGRVVADDILNNVDLGGDEPFGLTAPAFGSAEERLSPGLQGYMEGEFAPALSLMADAQTYLLAGDEEGVAGCLEQLAACIVRCSRIFREITPQANTKETFDPVVWIKSYPAMGNGIRPGELGNSGVDAPLFHALDAFMGREHKDGDFRGMQTQRRETMPKSLQAFFRALEDPSASVRAYVQQSRSARLIAAFDGVLQLYLWFLEWHRVKAIGITGVSLASGRHKTSSGVKSGSGGGKPTGPPISPVQMLSRAMKAGMASRKGRRDVAQLATIVKTTAAVPAAASGRQAALLTVAFDAALPLESGDRIQVWPENDPQVVEDALVVLWRWLRHFARDPTPYLAATREKLARRDLSNLEMMLSHQKGWEPLEDIVENLPTHTPRFYSVGDVNTNAQGLSHTAQLMVGAGDGVSTKFLLSRRAGDKVRARWHPCPRFNLPSDSSAPLVLIGQGSGVGPLLGFIRSRERLVAGGHNVGKMLLFIGARRRDNVLSIEQLVGLSHRLPLVVRLALSEDDCVDIVGGRLERHHGRSSRVPRILNEELAVIDDAVADGGHIFVCGSTEFGETVRKTLGVAPQASQQSLARDFTPSAAIDWHYYHEDLFGQRDAAIPERVITSAELALHNRFDDCWTSIDGVVYDLTEYLALHPGGAKVLMESAGTSSDARFHETHAGAQDVLGRLGPYAIGRLDAARLAEEEERMLEVMVRSQNALTNNTAFSRDRSVPFYAFCDALIVFAEAGVGTWRDAWSPAQGAGFEEVQMYFVRTFTELKSQCWSELEETACMSTATEMKLVYRREDEIRERYLKEAADLHKLIGYFKSSLARLDT